MRPKDLPLLVIQNVFWGIHKFCSWRCTCTGDNARIYGLLCRAVVQKGLTACLTGAAERQKEFRGDLEASFLGERRVAHLQEQHTLREQKGMKAATNGLGEMFPVGPAASMEEVSALSFPYHSGRITVPSTLPAEPIA